MPTTNFTDKNRGGVMDNDGSESGFRMIDMSDENGYGSTDKGAVSKKSGPSFVSNASSGSPINYSGMDDWGDARFSGKGQPSPLGEQGNSGKDAIKTGDDDDSALRSF